MSNNISINTNQTPYFDDYDEDKSFHQVLYKPSLPVQARELSTQQSILRNQIKRFGDHVFKNGSKVTGGELVLNLDYEYVKLKPQYNNVDINVTAFAGKTITGSQSGTKAMILGNSVVDATTGDPDTLYVKYITGGATSNSVQGINMTNTGSGYTELPTVTITGGGGSGATAVAVLSSGSIIAINISNKGLGYTSAPTVAISGGGGTGAVAVSTIITSPAFLGGERIVATDLSVSANVVDTTPTYIQTIKITAGGSGYTAAPTVTVAAPTSGVTATAIATITAGVVSSVTVTVGGSGYTSAPAITMSLPPAGGVVATASSYLATPTGKGSSASIAEGVFYINGNFVKTQAQTVILDKYANIPTYRIGLSAVETIVDSGADTTLLDNAQGSSNFAAPGADRLKLALTLGTKTLASVDDSDFYEVLRVENGIKTKDIKVPIYSELEKTFARRTFDESGSYTVRSHNIQLKDHPSDASKFLVRLDPGKSFVEGYEFETIVTTDIVVDKARTTVNVNNFDRLMQYGNFVVTKNYEGKFDISNHQEVDLHNVTYTSVNRGTPSSYASSKIGTAKVRNIDYVSGTGTALIINMYLYDIKITSASSTFAACECIHVPVSASTTPIVTSAFCEIDNTGKVGGTAGGDAKLFETSDNTLVFKLPQDTINTIRDASSNVDTSYTTKRVFENVAFTAGVATIATAGGSETFMGSGVLSATNKREHYLTTVKTAGNSGYSVNAIVPMDGSGQTVTVNGPSNTTITFDCNIAGNFTADIIATINIDTKQEKSKALVSNHVKNFTTPNTTALSYDLLAKSDIWKIKAIYDSENAGSNATLPTLTVTSTNETLTPGETITGIQSGAKGTVVVGASGTTSVTYVPVSGTFIAEDVTGATSGFTKAVSSVASGDTDITSRYILDNGQKDSFYDHGRVQLKSGATAASGRIAVVFDYFTHSGTGYLSVDSYTSAVGFDNVPKFTSPVTGDEVELRDCVDFRPRRADDGTAMQNIELPVPNTNWSADYSYYLPRVDTIFVSRERKFGSNTGVPSLTHVPPSRVQGTMNLYTLYIPAYTFKPSDVRTQYIENKRYTMRDIGALEKRIHNLEYYTSLSLLEKDTEELVIKDGNGLDRFKNGFLIDGFNGHSVGNVLSDDYLCSIDFDEKILRPRFNSNITDLVLDESASSGVTKNGDLVTLPYTSKAFVTQKIASKAINVNPFAVLAWIGRVDLEPSSDNWIDTNTRPEVVVNIGGQNDAWENLVGLGFGSQFGDWQTFGTGRERVVASSTTTERAGRGWPIRRRTTQTVVQDIAQTRTGIRTEITGVDTVRNSIGDRITDVSIVPFIRPRDITINVTGMKPNTRLYSYFDGEPVSAYVTPSGGSLGGAVFTDDAGSVANVIFSIPNTDTLRFRTGERQFLFTDNTTGDLVSASTYGEVTYTAQGLLQTKENVVVSTRVPRVESLGQGSATEFRQSTNTFDRVNVGGWFDPLAETFLVDEALYPDGIYLTDVDLFFKAKDDDGLPVSCQIRTTVNGYPAPVVLPFSDVSKLPADVNVSEDASVATKFTFPSIVYLQPGEYAIVVLSNSLKYEAWISEFGENIIGTTRKISEQPYAGVFFKSQNASTWSPDQNQDLSFVLNRAEFTTGTTAEAVFKDAGSAAEYKADIIQIVPQEAKMNQTAANWSIKMTDQGTGLLDTDYTNIVVNTNYYLDTPKKITTAAGSYVAKATLTSGSSHISPMIDIGRNSIITIENIVNNLSTNENNSSGGDATARYITRRVNLKDGFDATSLKMFVTANRQAGTSIKVYYKVLSQFDADTFEDRPWQDMKEITNSNAVSVSDNRDEYLELEFVPDNNAESTDYITSSVTYDSFKTFAIKIVMNSATTTRVPLLKDMRAIALA